VIENLQLGLRERLLVRSSLGKECNTQYNEVAGVIPTFLMFISEHRITGITHRKNSVNLLLVLCQFS